ncbi:MAG: flagellar protein FlgN [bacterium]|nr:flagellar protein FlgN [bacterium]
MIDKEVSELLVVLKSELEAGEELLKISKAQKQCIKNSDLNELKTNVDSSEDLLVKIMDMEDERRRIILNISLALNIPCEKLTISEIIKNAKSCNSMKVRELDNVKKRLSSVFNELMTFSKINQYLISRTLRFMGDRIKALNYNLTKSNTYGAKGLKERAKEPAIINKKI